MARIKLINNKQQWLCFLLITTLSTTLTILPESLQTLFIYNRESFSLAGCWRLITTSFIHTNPSHLLMNIAGLLTILLLSKTCLPSYQLLFILLTCCFFSGLGVAIFYPEIKWYVGLSGALHGLLVYIALREFKQDSVLFGLLLALLTCKLVYELSFGGNPITASQIQARVLVEGHLTGAVAGLLLAILSPLINWQSWR